MRRCTAKSKDLLAAGVISGRRCSEPDGVPAFSGDALNVASHWLDTYWSRVTYPLVEEDAILRRNALNCLADPMAVVEAFARVPLVRESPAWHLRSLRDVDIATRLSCQAGAGMSQVPGPRGQIRARGIQGDAARSTSSMPLSELTEGVARATASLDKIDGLMREGAGAEGWSPEVRPARSATVPSMSRGVARCQAHARRAPSWHGAPASASEDEAPTTTDGGIGRQTGRRHQVAAGCDSGAGCGGGVLPADRAVQSHTIPLLLERAKRSGVEAIFWKCLALTSHLDAVARGPGGRWSSREDA